MLIMCKFVENIITNGLHTAESNSNTIRQSSSSWTQIHFWDCSIYYKYYSGSCDLVNFVWVSRCEIQVMY